MENDLLIIKGKQYGVEDMHTLPKSLKPANVSSKSNTSTYGYFGELNPLSNFYQAPFTLDDKTFHCSEQYIQWKKAELFKDKAAMRRISRARTDHQCKEEGKNVSNYKNTIWEKKAKSLCKPSVKQKFVENSVPRDVLMQKTYGKKIVECSKEPVWGCGMPLKDDECLNQTKWTSQGIMGQMLEEIREELGSMLYASKIPDSSANQESHQSGNVPTPSTAPPYESSASSSSDSEDSNTDMQT